MNGFAVEQKVLQKPVFSRIYPTLFGQMRELQIMDTTSPFPWMVSDLFGGNRPLVTNAPCSVFASALCILHRARVVGAHQRGPDVRSKVSLQVLAP